MRAALYIRVSTRDQADEGYSLDAQRHDLEAYCTKKGYEIVNIYADEGISAKDAIHRPQFLQMMQDAKERKFDAIVVMRLTRFTRSIYDLCQAVETLQKMGVAFESVTEHIDVTTTVGRFLLYLLGVVAQWEREVVGNNVSCAATERARLGMPMYSRMLGYDYAGKNQRVINPDEAESVRKIYSLYLELGNLSEVSRRCQQLGLRGKRGGKLSPENIRIILTRFAYCGYYSYKRQPIKGDAKPIISVETYHAVQRLMEERGKTMRRIRKHPLVYLDVDK